MNKIIYLLAILITISYSSFSNNITNSFLNGFGNGFGGFIGKKIKLNAVTKIIHNSAVKDWDNNLTTQISNELPPLN